MYPKSGSGAGVLGCCNFNLYALGKAFMVGFFYGLHGDHVLITSNCAPDIIG